MSDDTARICSLIALIIGAVPIFVPLILVQLICAIIAWVNLGGFSWAKLISLFPGPIGGTASWLIYSDLNDKIKDWLKWLVFIIYWIIASVILYFVSPFGKATLMKTAKFKAMQNAKNEAAKLAHEQTIVRFKK